VAEVLAGRGVREVAREYGVDPGLVSRWVTDARNATPHARTREELAELIYDAVAETVKTLTARAVVTRREDWIEKQSAADLAILAGTEWDRVIRMVAGFRPADATDQPQLDAARPPANPDG